MNKIKNAWWRLVAFFLTGKIGSRAQYTKMKIKDREKRSFRVFKNVENIRFNRGEKKYYLGDTNVFVWARSEEKAQTKMKAHLLKLKLKYDKENGIVPN